jgi:histidinol-phosphate aminotransferase
LPKNNEEILEQVLNKAQSLEIYDVGETIEKLAHKINVKPSQIIKLNSNENFFVPLNFLRKILKDSVDEIDPRIYPRDEPKELQESLSQYLKISSNNIIIGTGSDQLIDLVSQMFLGSRDEALSISPTFSIYKRCVKIHKAKYIEIPLREDFSLDLAKILKAVTDTTKLIFLCSPNNPTANQFDTEAIKLLAEKFNGVIGVDEAYVDFSDSSIVNLIKDFENLIIFRTFSKVFGLAGLRVGYAISNQKLSKILNEKFQMPYSVTLLALKSTLKILENINIINKTIVEIKEAREKLIDSLNKIHGIRAFDSETNFVLFQACRSSDEIYKALLKKGIIIRNIGRVLRYKNCLRVTIGPNFMMQKFLSALTEIMI